MRVFFPNIQRSSNIASSSSSSPRRWRWGGRRWIPARYQGRHLRKNEHQSSQSITTAALTLVGSLVGLALGLVGFLVGTRVGFRVGSLVGNRVGDLLEGEADGTVPNVGNIVGTVGEKELGRAVGVLVGPTTQFGTRSAGAPLADTRNGGIGALTTSQYLSLAEPQLKAWMRTWYS